MESMNTMRDPLPQRDSQPLPVSWKIHRERALILGWGRAVLLQLAHPLVAAGVADHSRFDQEPGGRRSRAEHTIHAFLSLSFGNQDEAQHAAGRINSIHGWVHGELGEATKRLPAGTPYSATDPALETWVHATLVDSFLRTYQRFVGPLTRDEQDCYCAEVRALGPWLGVPPEMLPGSARELRDYMADMRARGEIEVTRTARDLAASLLAPGSGPFERAVVPLMRLSTIEMLPVDLRRAYDLPSSRRDAWSFEFVTRWIRRLLPLLPSSVRYWPEARRALAEGRIANVAVPEELPGSSEAA